MAWKQPTLKKNEVNILLGILIMVLLIAMVFVPFKTMYTMEFPATIQVTGQTNYADVNRPTDILDFGVVSQGLRVKKYLELNNGNAQDAIVYVKVKGEIAKFISLDSEKFIIDGPRQLGITAKMPDDITPGIYNGVVSVEYKLTFARRIINIFN